MSQPPSQDPSAPHHLLPYFSDSVPGRNRWPLVLAHRGADVQRENTLGAIRDAVEQGFGYIEIDVRTTADGHVVVFHDETLDRITTGSGKLADHTWEDLQTVRMIGPQPRNVTVDEPLALLDDVLAAFPDTRFNIDLKDEASAAPLVELLRKHNAWDRVLVTAFQDRHRKAFFRSLPPDVPVVATSAGAITVIALFLAQFIGGVPTVARWLRKRLPLHALQIPARRGLLQVVSKRFVDVCHQAGIAVHVWVVNDPAEMEELLAIGVDGLVTDDGAAAAQVLGSRGQWPQRF